MNYTTFETGLPGVTVDVDAEAREVMADGWHWRFAGVWGLRGAKVRGVHVMSSAAGGEIRGYVLDEDGGLRLRGPCHTGNWPELDAEVARVLGAHVVPYVIGAGGGVEAAVDGSPAGQMSIEGVA